MTTPHVLTEADVTEAIRRVELGIKTIEQGVKRHGTTLPWDYRLPLDALAWAAGALSFVQAVLSRLAIAERAGPKWIDGPPTEPGAYWWCFHDGAGADVMTPRPCGSNPTAHHNTMVTYRPSAALDEDQVCRAWCEDCGWSIDGQSYEHAVDHALGHQRATEAQP